MQAAERSEGTAYIVCFYMFANKYHCDKLHLNVLQGLAVLGTPPHRR